MQHVNGAGIAITGPRVKIEGGGGGGGGKERKKKKERMEGYGAARGKVSSARSYGKHVTIERSRLLVKDTWKV